MLTAQCFSTCTQHTTTLILSISLTQRKISDPPIQTNDLHGEDMESAPIDNKDRKGDTFLLNTREKQDAHWQRQNMAGNNVLCWLSSGWVKPPSHYHLPNGGPHAKWKVTSVIWLLIIWVLWPISLAGRDLVRPRWDWAPHTRQLCAQIPEHAFAHTN